MRLSAIKAAKSFLSFVSFTVIQIYARIKCAVKNHTVSKKLFLILRLSPSNGGLTKLIYYHRFRFYATTVVFHQKKILFWLPSIIDTMYGNARGEPALRVTVFSYRGRVVYSFSEGFRVQDIATILHVGCTFLKMLIKLYRETSTVLSTRLIWYVCRLWDMVFS